MVSMHGVRFLRLRPMLALVAGCTLASSVAEAATKVACIGDSITAGAGLVSPGTDAYPAVLQSLLGSDYEVVNFGHSGATLLLSGDLPYTAQAEYAASNSFDPDVVVIMLGTNDAKPGNWAHESDFEGDYADLIHHYESLGAFVYAVLPPPVYGAGCCWIQGSVVNDAIVAHIHHVASAENVPIIDVFTALSNHAEDFLDGVHPTVAGDKILAQTVYDALRDGGAGGAPDAGGGRAEGGVGGSAGQSDGGNGGRNQGGMAGSAGAPGGGAFGSGGSRSVDGSAGSVTSGAPGLGGSVGKGGAAGGEDPGGAESQNDDASSGCSCQFPPRAGSEGAWGLLWFGVLAARWRHRRGRKFAASLPTRN
jgi:lysophospholipase L1-like esterase